MKHTKLLTGALLILITIPATTVLAGPFNPTWAMQFLNGVGRTLNAFIPIIIGIALLVFIWGVVQFIATDDEKKRAEGRRKIAWGLVGLFVLISIWGLVLLIQTLMGIRGEQVRQPQDFFAPAPPSSGGNIEARCVNNSDPCPDGSGWTCGSPCCPFSGLNPNLCIRGGG